jgi:hypothetical protein
MSGFDPEPGAPDHAGAAPGREGRMEAALGEVAARLAALEARLGAPGTTPAPVDAVAEAWRAAPLSLRLSFASGLLPSEDPGSPLRRALQEAAGLAGLWAKGPELERWIAAYPALFVSAYAALVGAGAPRSPGERLAVALLQEVRALVEGALQAAGGSLVSPRSGDVVSDEHQVISEEASAAAEGGIARCARPGLRLRGELVVPAQVVRSRGADPAPARAAELRPAEVPPEPEAEPPPLTPERWPDWLKALHRSAAATGSAAESATHSGLTRLAEEAIRARAAGVPLPDAELVYLLTPLLPFLEQRRPAGPAEPAGPFTAAHGELLLWLQEELEISLIQPYEGEPFVEGMMEAFGERISAHPAEWGTVARLESAGLRRGGAVLVPARVVRYAAGGAQ